MRRLYALLLHLYPREYRDLFGLEVLEVFGQASDEHWQRGLVVWLRFSITEFSDAIVSAARHWIDRLFWNRVPQNEIAGATRPQLFSSMQAAQNRVDVNIRRMTQAIGNHDFVGARNWSYEEKRARAELQRLRDLYGFGDEDQLTPQ